MASIVRRVLGGVTGIFESRVTRVARFVTIPESVDGFTVGGQGISDRHFQNVHLPGLLQNSNAVVFVRVRPLGKGATVQVRFNQTIVARFTFAEPPSAPFHLHKVLSPRALEPEKNELIFSASGPTAPAVEFSDVVIVYQSDETTVKGPDPVLHGG